VPIPPRSRRISERRVTEGQFVQSDSTPIHGRGSVDRVGIGDLFERDLHLAGAGQPAAITDAAIQASASRPRELTISEVIDPVTRAARLRISVPNRVDG